MTQAASSPETPVTPPPAPEPAAAEPSIDELAAKLFRDDDPAHVAETEEKPAETKPEEPAADPKAERIAARITAARRIELAAAKQRAELRTKEEEIARKVADLDTREKKLRLIEEDPVRFFEEFKADPKAFLEKLAGEHAPENVTAKKLAQLETELKAEREAREKIQREAEQRQQHTQVEQKWNDAAQGFIAHVEASAAQYPHLVAEFDEKEALDLAWRVLSEVVGHDQDGQPITRVDAYKNRFGKEPDDDVVAEHLDLLAKQRAEARQKSVWRKREESAASGSQPLSNGDPNHKAPPVTRGSSPRTLTSRAASEKAAAPRQMTQEEIDAESIRILQSAFKD